MFKGILDCFQFQVWQAYMSCQIRVKSLKVGMEKYVMDFFFLDFFQMPAMKQLENRESLKDSYSPPSVKKFH